MPAGVVERYFLEPAADNFPDDILNGPRFGSENLDPGVLEHLHGSKTHAAGNDGIDLSSLEGRNRMALAMGVVLIAVVDDLDALPFNIDESEEGGASEVPVDPGLQTLIRFGRDADFHGRTPPRKPSRPPLPPQPRSAGTRWKSAFPH